MVHTLKSVRKGYLEIKEDVSVKRTNRTTNTPSWPSIGSPAITNLVDESIDTIPSTSSFAGIWTLAWLRVESSFPPLLTLTNSQVNVWPTSAFISSRARSVMNWDVTPWKHWHNHGVTTCLFVCLFRSCSLHCFVWLDFFGHHKENFIWNEKFSRRIVLMNCYWKLIAFRVDFFYKSQT